MSSNRRKRREAKQVILKGAINFGKLNEDLNRLVGDTHAYVFMVWPFGQVEAGMNYVSNADRDQMIPALEDAADVLNKRKEESAFNVANELLDIADHIEELMDTQRPKMIAAIRDAAEKLKETDKHRQNPDLN